MRRKTRRATLIFRKLGESTRHKFLLSDISLAISPRERGSFGCTEREESGRIYVSNSRKDIEKATGQDIWLAGQRDSDM